MTYLFNDGPGEPKKERSQFQRVLRRTIILTVCLFLLFMLGLRILTVVGGNSPQLQGGLEQYLQGMTGLTAKIGHLQSAMFYPDLAVDASDVVFTFPPGGANAGAVAATVRSIKVSRNFWDVFFRRPRLGEIDIRGVDLMQMLNLPRPVRLDSILLAKTSQDGHAALTISGHYGDDEFHASQDMAWTQQPGRSAFYTRPDKSEVSFTAPFLNFQALSTAAPHQLRLDFTSIGLPQKMLTGTALIERDGEAYTFSGDLKGGHSEFMPDIHREKNRVTGHLRMPVFAPSDLKILLAARDVYNLLTPAAPGGMISPDLKLDIDVTADQIYVMDDKTGKGGPAGKFAFPVHTENGVLTAGPLTGDFSGGALTGSLTLDGGKTAANLVLRATAKDIDYGVLQQALYGQADISGRAALGLSLNSAGATAKDLINNLKGEIALVAGSGVLKTRMLDVWGSGLVGVMLPRIDPDAGMKLNCMIADFTLGGGVARPAPLFLDSDRVTIAGDGAITLADRKIDMILTPKAKGAVLLNLALPVHITGPLDNPAFNVDAEAVGKKAGALLLGTINPAFMAFSMSDLGLTADHPCSAYLGKPAP